MEKIQYVHRRGTNCAKWDNQTAVFSEDGLTGLWVADMDFKVAECVTDALRKAVDFGVFGYANPSDGYFEAVIDWEKSHHGYELQREWFRFSPGVVPAFNWLMLMKTQPGDAVMVVSPTYYPMMDAPRDNQRKLVISELVLRDGRYEMDFEDFERKIVENDVKVFLFCSPHNPCGRVWEREELCRMMEICRKHNVFVISDEIHQDLTFGGHKHIPTALAGDYDHMLATLIAPSKTFNLAGLQNSVVILPDEKLRAEFDAFLTGIRVRSGNTMGYLAAEAAYRGGGEWLEAVKEIIAGNEKLVRQTLAAAMPEVFMPELQGTYLLWLDFSHYLKPEQMTDFFEKRCRLAMDYGSWFNGKPCCVRMNLATSEEVIRGAVDTIVKEYARLKDGK